MAINRPQKHFLILLIILVISACQSKDTTSQKTSSDRSNTENISALLQTMTLEEKVGQMTQLTLSVFYKNGLLQDSLLSNYITKYNIGSLLNIPSSSAITIDQWRELIRKIADLTQETNLKIPVLYGIDAIHGASYTENATLFPHNIGLAASRNSALAYTIAKITAKEVRASGVRWNFDPVLGVGRQPLWPRFEETFGEDPLLVSEFGLQAIKGYEGDDLKNAINVASCMKHFIGYSVPLSGKDRTPAYISDMMLQDIYIPPFKKAVESGASTLMINSGSVNGIPVHSNKHLLTDLLKKEWGFEGLVVTDWLDIQYLYTQHHIAKDNKDAVKLAINAGIDMSMVPFDLSFYTDLIALVNEGEVSMARIDDAVSRILKVKFDLGLFDNPYPEEDARTHFGLLDYQTTALATAQETITLLKNDTLQKQAILPLSKNTKLLIAGPGANSLAALHGSWSYTWEGQADDKYPASTLSIREAIAQKIGEAQVTSIAPATFKDTSTSQIAQLQGNLDGIDCIVLCLGENSYAESNGNINDLTLSKDQIALAKAAIATKKPVVLVLTEGRPRIIADIASEIPGIILAYRAGSKGANAIADVLFGDYNPSGKLPFSYPKHTGNIITYDAPVRNQSFYKPQWPFGHGLSYTTFAYSDLEVSTATLKPQDTLTVQLRVSNTGARDGQVAIDLFVSDLVASVIPPMKKLRKFKKIDLAVGESKQVTFTLHKDDLSFVNTELETVTEAGEFEIAIGDKTARFYYQDKKEVD